MPVELLRLHVALTSNHPCVINPPWNAQLYATLTIGQLVFRSQVTLA